MGERSITSYPLGVTGNENTIEGIASDNYHFGDDVNGVKIAVIGGLSGTQDCQKVYQEGLTVLFTLPDDIAFIASDLTSSSSPVRDQTFPPENGFFFDKDSVESRYVWRWITMESPDLIIELRHGKNTNVIQSENYTEREKNSLLGEISLGLGPTPGPIPSVQITGTTGTVKDLILKTIDNVRGNSPSHSPARIELNQRSSRSPLETAEILGDRYGYKLDEPVNYVQGVAISGRLRLHSLTDSTPNPSKQIASFVNFLTTDEGFERNNKSGPNLAGICWAPELAEATGENIWNELLLNAANTYETVDRGVSPSPCHPDFGCEDMFFISAVCGRAFKLTEDSRFIRKFVDFLLESGIQQENGLMWHCRSAPFFWGRGNGFAALAYSEALTYIPNNHPDRITLANTHTRHLKGLSDLQLPNGMWTQLLDFAGTYQELSATCMIGYALARGIRKGWLDDSFRDTVEKAWNATNRRISNDGDLVDVCTGTGFQSNRSDYLYREAEYGYDDRGGSMAIWFAIEMEKLHQALPLI